MLTMTINQEAVAELVELVATAVVAKLQADCTALTRPGREVLTEKLLLPTDEAAAACSISARLLWDLTAPRGPIHSVRAGSRVLYPISELRRWIEAETKSSVAASTK